MHSQYLLLILFLRAGGGSAQASHAVEQGPRGYYTGIFGCFDGENLDSAVNIRYLEKKDGQLLYRSGGGITFLSDLESEYNELIEKIYVPVV